MEVLPSRGTRNRSKVMNLAFPSGGGDAHSLHAAYFYYRRGPVRVRLFLVLKLKCNGIIEPDRV